MDFSKLIKTRQSCRKYEGDRTVARELIDKCIDAARLAPSACNSQPWSFLVVDTEPLKTELCEKAFSGIYSMNKFATNASAIVIVITERSRYVARLGGILRGVKYALIDIGIAGEHFDLQAAELGLGTCWIGWFNEKAVKKVLKLPRSVKIDVIFSIGYPAQTEREVRVKKRKTLDEIRTYP